jgi:hypothetical protein
MAASTEPRYCGSFSTEMASERPQSLKPSRMRSKSSSHATTVMRRRFCAGTSSDASRAKPAISATIDWLILNSCGRSQARGCKGG